MENAFRVISPCSAPISSPINLFCTVIVLFTRLIIYFFRQLIQIYPAEKLNYLPGDGNTPAGKSKKWSLRIRKRIEIFPFYLYNEKKPNSTSNDNMFVFRW